MNKPMITGFLREAQILPQREITEEEAARNRAAAKKARDDAEALGIKPKVFTRPRRARPASLGIIPVSHATWWAGVKSGRFPKPLKFGRCTVWRAEDILHLIEQK